MTAAARRAIIAIRSCINSDSYALTIHFSQRMRQRGLFWPDVQAIIDDLNDVWTQGLDEFGRPKWIISGSPQIDDPVEIVCALEVDRSGAEFITLYWKD